MPANTDPIFSRLGAIAWADAVLGPTAMTTADGSGSSIFPVWQADANNGGFLRLIRAKCCTTTLTTASLMRAYISSFTGSPFTAGTSNTIANTWLYAEIPLPAVQIGNNPTPDFDIPFGFALDPGYRVLVSFHTSTGAAGVGFRVGALAGRY